MRRLLLLILLATPLAALAQLGAKLDVLTQQLGNPVTPPPKAVAPVTASQEFRTKDWLVRADFLGETCERLAFRPLTKDVPAPTADSPAVKAALLASAGGAEWKEAAPPAADPHAGKEPPAKTWVRGGGQAFAYLTSRQLSVCSAKYIEAQRQAREAAAQQQRYAELLLVVKGKDFEKALQALRDISRLGDSFHDKLLGCTTDLLNANRRQLDAGLRQAGTREPAAEEALTALRAKALAHIAGLAKDDKQLALAEENYRDLLRQSGLLERKLKARADAAVAVAATLRQRDRLIRILKQLTPETDPRLTADAHVETGAKIAFGAAPGEVRDLPAPEGQEPDNAALRLVWRYQVNRRLEAYNQVVAKGRTLTRNESEHLDILNEYREALGLLRLELDARLVQAARQHSKEMNDLGYFSHESPKAENKSFDQRIRNAGYEQPGGENIAMNDKDGKTAFWMWFHSPGHHQNMTRPSFTGVGVGNHGRYWTQNFGTGPLLTFAPPAARQAAQVKGPSAAP